MPDSTIIDIRHRGKKVEVIKMVNGTYTAFVDDVLTQKDLPSDSMIRYLGHMMHEEKPPTT